MKPTRFTLLEDPKTSQLIRELLAKSDQLGLVTMIDELATVLVVLNEELEWIIKQEVK